MWYFWGKNSSIVRFSKVFGISRTMLFVIFWSAIRSLLTLDLNVQCSVSIGDTSNFSYMATKVPFEAGDFLIFRPKVDRCVDSTQSDYGGLKILSLSVLLQLQKNSGKIQTSSEKSMNLFNMRKTGLTYLFIGQFFCQFINSLAAL